MRSPEHARLVRTYIEELPQLERMLKAMPYFMESTVETTVTVDSLELPVYSISAGNPDKSAPALLIVGGVHGIERIGSHVVMSMLHSFIEKSRWDKGLEKLLEKFRIVVVPILNPGGMYLNLRCNPGGVDLMRNSPIEATDKIAFLVGGQRFSKRFAWYRGEPERGMEPENIALENLIDRELKGRPFSLVLDCHSGFGFHDRIWFPYAYRRRPVRKIDTIMAMKLLWESTYPYHDYIFEPQSNHYLTHGDLWDYFYKKLNKNQAGTFLPFTLEMGSWKWVKKRPRQLFTIKGLFNPEVPHRQDRVMRRHLVLFDFLMNAAVNYQQWMPTPSEVPRLRQMALTHWYDGAVIK
ncbi:zinc carboxypeptidase-related protein [Oleiphilus messinensis]|uniref:Zinc carboxypeptidase-related protein n=2 Tax=Oleiphilus messinensis TaxID=141451 RepID=A0A1Y0IGA4_9GAMM|nr:zinc carboxypeptidase-related protein [Oleiphilus messinensis]